MGGCLSMDSDEIHQRELESLDKVREREDVVEKNRKCTDVGFVVLLAVFLLLLFGFLGYLGAHSDLARLVNGYDECGNICGKTNKKVEEFPCTGEDMTEKPYLLTYNDTSINFMRRECVFNCSVRPNFTEIFNRCYEVKETHYPNKTMRNKKTNATREIPSSNVTEILKISKGFFEELNEDFRNSWFEITMLLLLAIVLVGIMMVQLRFATKFTVWFLLIGSILFFVALATYCWILWALTKTETTDKSSKNVGDTKMMYLIAAIVFTVCSVIAIILVVLMRKKIRLVIQLIKEAGKSIIAMPAIIFEPLLTILALGIACSMWLYITVLGMSAGNLTKHRHNILEYDSNAFMSFILWFNLFVLYWIIQFIVGCQHMTIAGSIARWYFAKDKNNLGSPIFTSLMTVVKYHMGSIAFGALIIAIIQFVKTLVNALKESIKKDNAALAFFIDFCVKCILNCVEEIMKYFSRNSYIQTAIYGHPFCRAGKRAFTMLSKNIFNILAINTIGDNVLSMAKLFIIVATLLVGFEVLKDKEDLHHVWFLLVVVGLFAWLVSHCFITIYEMSIDTIFMCFCEDCALNDGETRPYYMSKNLMLFVEESNRILVVKPNNGVQAA